MSAGQPTAGGKQPAKPLPKPDEDTGPFWDACRRHELRMQRCAACGVVRFRPQPVCPACLSVEAEWALLSGRGAIYTYGVVRSPMMPAFAADVPYILALVQLEEGPRLTTNIVECGPEDVRIGAPVEVIFDDVTPEISLPKFRLVR